MIKLYTHSDLDAAGCIILFKAFFDDKVDISINGNPQKLSKQILEDFDTLKDYRHIYITDISVSADVAEKLDVYKDKLTLLDHHKTALHLNDYSWANVRFLEDELGKPCGTSMVFDYLLTKEFIREDFTLLFHLELLVNGIREFDTWEFTKTDNDMSKQLNDLLKLYGMKYFTEKYISMFSDDFDEDKNYSIFNDIDKKLLAIEAEKIENYIKHKSETIIKKDLFGYKAGIVFSELYTSEMGNKLNLDYPKLDFIMIINTSNSTCSLRTINDIDLSEIAKKLCGGGHPKASGFPINQALLDNFIVGIDSYF